MSITPQERQWGRGLCHQSCSSSPKFGKIHFPLSPQYKCISHPIWAGLELNPGGAVGRCPLCELCPVPILQGWDVCDCCNGPMDRGRGMFSVLWQLLALCVSLQLGSTTAARSEITPTVFGQVLLLLWFTLSPPRLTIAKGTLAKGEHDC